MADKRQSKLKRLVTIRNLNILVLIFIMLVVLYALFAPLTPAKYNSIRVENADSVTSSGQLTYMVDRCRYVTENVPTTIIRNLVSTDKNGKEIAGASPISLNSDLVATKRGCLTETRTVLLPTNTPIGYYKMKIISIYSIIPVRKPTAITAYSNVFYVKPLSLGAKVQALQVELQQFQAYVDANGGKLPPNFDFSTQGTTSAVPTGEALPQQLDTTITQIQNSINGSPSR